MNNFNIVWLIILFVFLAVVFIHETYIVIISTIDDIKSKNSLSYLILDIIALIAFLNIIYSLFKLIQYCIYFLLK